MTMRSISLLGTIAMCVGLSILSPISAQDTGLVDLDAVTSRLETEIDKILEETGIPAISLALVRGGDVVWAGAYGYANVGAGVPATPAAPIKS